VRRAPLAFPIVLAASVVLAGSEVEEAEAGEPPEIHECVDAAGNLSFQNDPCETPAPPAKPVRVVAAVTAPAPLPPPPAAPPIQRSAPSRPPIVAVPDADDPEEEPDGPPDPRLGSPEGTWRTLRGALRSGDRALAASCLTSSALAEATLALDSLPAERLREIADALPEIDVRGDAGPFKVATAKSRAPRPRWIFFERTRRGDWKIAAMPSSAD
jgi:hypothetical protein